MKKMPDKNVGPPDLSAPQMEWQDGMTDEVKLQTWVKRSGGHVPHWQFGGSYYFITFRSAIGILDEASRMIVETLKKGHSKQFDLVLAVVMPDHVHLLFKPLRKEENVFYDLAQIMKGIKGASAHEINQGLGRKGTVWQKDYFDRIIKNIAEYSEVEGYMLNNPITAGLAMGIGEYKFCLDYRGQMRIV